MDFHASYEDDSLIYFPPGIHRTGLILLHSRQTVFIDAGAVVYGSILAMNSSDVKVIGYGILDGSYELRYSDTRLLPDDFDSQIKTNDEIKSVLERNKVLNGCIRFYNCQNVTVKGIV